MKALLERLKAGERIVGDGALGTMLLQRGLKPGQCPESLALSDPEILEDIARQYVEAGAELVTTNTFGASPLKLAMYDLADRTEEINRAAVGAVRKAVGSRAYVLASCGPTGKILKPYGDADPDEVYRGYRRQVEALFAAGVDVICLETMTDLNEATLAIKAAKDVSAAIPVMATMTFDATPRGFYTIMGVSIEKAATGLTAAGADAVGSNCGNGIENMVKIAAEYRRFTTQPIIIQSNAGLPQIKDGQPVYPESPEFMAAKVADLLDLGVSIIGGCCGTTPAHIQAIRQAVDAWTARE